MKSVQKELTTKRCLLILDLKPFRSQVKGKHSMGREFQSLAVWRKETVDQYIHVTQKNHAIYQNNEYTSLENKEMEPVEPVQMNIYQSNAYRTDLSWLHFDNEPRVEQRQQVKDQKSCISVFVPYLKFPSSKQRHQIRHDNSIPCMAVW